MSFKRIGKKFRRSVEPDDGRVMKRAMLLHNQYECAGTAPRFQISVRGGGLVKGISSWSVNRNHPCAKCREEATDMNGELFRGVCKVSVVRPRDGDRL